MEDALNIWLWMKPRLSPKRLLIVIPTLAVFASAFEVLLAALNVAGWIRAFPASVAVAASIVIASATWAERKQARQQLLSETAASEAAQEALRVSRCAHSVHAWPLPRVDEANPHSIGVARASVGDELPTYIPRDVEIKGIERLKRHGVVLLVGSPLSGVTRTAFEILLKTRPSALIIAPISPDGLRITLDELNALSKVHQPTNYAVWLDRIDEFDGEDDLTVEMLKRARAFGASTLIVATVRTSSLLAWEASNKEVAYYFGKPLLLERDLSFRETQVATATFPGVDFRFGLAAAFTRAGALLHRRRAGFANCSHEAEPGDCSVVRAIVNAAASRGSAGDTRPLESSRLERLVQIRLGRPIELSHFQEAIQWLTSPALHGGALLLKVESEGRFHVKLAPEVQVLLEEEFSPPDYQDWLQAISDATEDLDYITLAKIGRTALSVGCNLIANIAWKEIPTYDLDSVAVLWESAKIARRTHAPQPLTIIHELVSAEYGHSSNHATVVLLLLARAWHGIAEYAVAHDIYTEIVAHFESNFGPSHVNTGVARLGLAHHFRHLDAGQLAVDEATKAVSIFINFYGNDHPNIGLALQERAATLVFNDTAQAMQIAQMSTALLEDTGASALAVASSKLVQVRCLVKLNRPQAAIALLREILDVTQREGGDTQVLCAETIDLESARRDLGLSDTEEFSEPNQVSIARILEMMADCHLHTSHFAQAKELYLEARRTYVRELGADCWDILSIDESLAEVLLYEGNRESAFAIYERLIARYRIDYGATSYHLAKVLEAAAQGCLREQYTEQAEAYAHAALEILEHNFGENGERLIGIYGLMGRLMAAKGDLSRATHFSEMAVTNARAFLPNGAYDLRVAIQDLRAIRPDWMVADSGEIFRGSV